MFSDRHNPVHQNKLIRAGCQTLNRQLRIGVLFTRRISAHRNPCPRRIAYLAIPRTVRTQACAEGVIITERPQHIIILVKHKSS